jgi:hypothetical protein
MPRRPLHLILSQVLQALDAGLLSRCRFLFGGGTRIALELDEFRESKDLDFLCSDASSYGDLRLLASREGYGALLPGAERAGVRFPREMKVDQYGIRFPAVLGEVTIRVELIREARLDLGASTRVPGVPVECLSLPDVYAEKLLANSDRWADRQGLSRDLVDLAALRRWRGSVPPEAWKAAETAYRSAPRDDLGAAVTAFLADPLYQRRCFDGLAVEAPAAIIEGIEELRSDLSHASL